MLLRLQIKGSSILCKKIERRIDTFHYFPDFTFINKDQFQLLLFPLLLGARLFWEQPVTTFRPHHLATGPTTPPLGVRLAP